MDVADELGYYPNYHARALALEKSYSLGLIIENLLDPFFLELVKGIEIMARKMEYNIMLSTVYNSKNLDEIINIFVQQSSVEGVLIGGNYGMLKKANLKKFFMKKNTFGCNIARNT